MNSVGCSTYGADEMNLEECVEELEVVKGKLADRNGSKKNSLWYWWFMIGSVGLLLFMSCALTYTYFLDGTVLNQPVSYWPGSFEVQNTPLHQGDPVTIRMYATKYRNIVPKVHWSLVHLATGQSWSFVKDGTTQLGYSETITRIAIIPDDAPPGKYKMTGTSTYMLDQRFIQYHLESTIFEVVPKPSDTVIQPHPFNGTENRNKSGAK